MSSEFSPINRIGNFYDNSVEEPTVLWREFSEWSDFPVWLPDYVDEETDDGSVADDSSAFQRLLDIVMREALDLRATSVEFSPNREDVVVQSGADGGKDEVGALPHGAYESFVRYLHRVADADRLEMTVAGRCIRLKIEFSQTEYGTRTTLHLGELEVEETKPPAV